MRPDQNPGQQCRRRGPGALFSPALLALVLVIVCTPTGAEAQRPDNIPRIGYLILSPLADPPSAERQAFLDGLRDLGYVVGRNIIIEYRSAAWNRELLPDLAAELVDRKVALIVAVPGAIEAARDATKTIPIVITSGSDPLERGLVASLARPGGNITGTANSSIELTGKRLELLREALPKISRVAVLWNPTSETAPLQWSAAQAAGGERSQGLPRRLRGNAAEPPRRAHDLRQPAHNGVSTHHRGVRDKDQAADDVRSAGGRGGWRPLVLCAQPA